MGQTPGVASSDACLVIPMFNEATVIERVVREVRSAFTDVVCVDDGSIDDTAILARSAGAHVVRHASNLGQGAALQTGLSYALANTSASWFVTFDADGQHSLEDVLRLLEHARNAKVDVVLGSRFLAPSSNIPRWRRRVLGAAVVFTRLTTRLHVTDTHNGLRVLSRTATTKISIRLSGMAHASEILEQIARHGLTYLEAPVSIQYTEYSRRKGQGNVNALNIMFELLIHRMRASV